MGKKLVDLSQSGLHVVLDNSDVLRQSIDMLTSREVLVGWPEETTTRDDALPENAGVTNASLAYIHDNGAPEANIPARPFMVPGMKNAEAEVTDTLAKAAQYALASRPQQVLVGFDRAGLQAVKGIQTAIREGIPPPLSEYTLQRRAAKGRKGAQGELDRRGRGLAPGMHGAVPLMDTNEMLKSCTYVVRKRSQRET